MSIFWNISWEKWKKDNDDDKVKSLNPQVKIGTVSSLYEERPKYDDELHQKLFKSRVLDKVEIP